MPMARSPQHPMEMPQTALSASIEQFKTAYEINAIWSGKSYTGIDQFIENPPEPRIVNVSSSVPARDLCPGIAILTINITTLKVPHIIQEALNMYTISLACELRGTNFKINAVSPGFTKTDFNNNRETGTSKDAEKRIIKHTVIAPDGPSEKFFREETTPETGEIPGRKNTVCNK